MSAGVEALLALLLIVSVMAMLVGIAVWILRPIDRAAKERRAPLQFTLVDFLCLFVLVQLPMALIHGFFTDQELGLRWTLDVYAWIAVGTFWLLSVQVLSRAGVCRPRHRAIFLAFIAPSAILGVIAVPALTALTAVALFASARGEDVFARTDRGKVAAGVAVYVVLCACVYISGRFTRRMVAAASAVDAEVLD